MGKYHVSLAETLPEHIHMDQTMDIETKGEWFGHSLGLAVGRVYDDGRIESFLKHDNGGTEWFDELREKHLLRSKRRHLTVLSNDRTTYKESDCDEYYLMYTVSDHMSHLPTVTKTFLDTCMNVDFTYTYEILFVGDDGFKRYFYKTINTSGPHTYSLLDELEDLENLIEEWAEDGVYGLCYDAYGDLNLKMYDDFGETLNASFSDTQELMMSINSIRIVKMEREIVDRHPNSSSR